MSVLARRLNEAFNHYAVNSNHADIIGVSNGIIDIMNAVRRNYMVPNETLSAEESLKALASELRMMAVNHSNYAYQGMVQLALNDIQRIKREEDKT